MDSSASADRAVVRVTCTAGASELVADRMLVSGASAVSEEAVGGAAVSEEAVERAGAVLVGDVDPGEIDGLVEFVGQLDAGATVELLEPDEDHLDRWRPFARAVVAGRFLVRPPWVAPGQHGSGPHNSGPLGTGAYDTEVLVDPGRSFGSGSHPTTRMCLRAISDLAPAGSGRGPGRVADIGCGSGVLAVAALLAGADSAVGVDVDPEAATASVAVASANGVAWRYRFEPGGIEALVGAGDRFDLVLANLLVPVIEALGADLRALCVPDGVIVLSGLLAEQRDRALVAVGAGTALVREYREDGWHTLVTRPEQP